MTALETAQCLLKLGFHPIPVHAKRKRPFGEAWPEKTWTNEKLVAHYTAHHDANIGIKLGEQGGIIDVETDDPESEAVLNALFPKLPPTVSYKSNRGVHRLYRFNPLLRGCKNVVNLNIRGERAKAGEPHVECRIGGGDGAQSLLPPSEVAGDDRPREHINDWSHEVAEFPDDYAQMIAAPVERTQKAKSYNKLATKVPYSWQALLEKAGGKSCGENQWTRPGKDSGVSASIIKAKDDTEILHVFTSNWSPLEQGGNYNLFTLYALIEHSGDHAAARKALNPSTAHQLTSYEIETFKTPGGDAHATIEVNGHFETHKIDSQAFKLWLQNQHWRTTGDPANAEAINQAVAIYKSKALFDSPTIEVYNRICPTPDAIYLDKADDKWRVVKITASGVEILDKSPIKFRRPKGSLPLPEPDLNGTIDELRSFLNVSDSDFKLICFVLASWFYLGPYIILLIESMAGSAKTTTLRYLRSIIDPNQCVARFTPKNEEDFFLSARNSYIFTLDNLSKLSEWMADALCILATGGGMSLREFYQQDDEVIMDVMRPAMLTTIVDLSFRSDFLRRSVLVHLKPIADFSTLDTLDADFAKAQPKILGALCRAASVGLQNYHKIDNKQPYSLPNFVRWCKAVESAFGWEAGTFDKLYKANRAEVDELVAANPIAQALVKIKRPFDGKMKELSAALVEQKADPAEWHNSPQSLSAHIKRLRGALPGINITVKPNRVIITDMAIAG